MPLITLTTRIKAPVGRVFDLARSIDLHLKSAEAGTDRAIQRAVAGRTEGLLEEDEEITWVGSHFGIQHSLTLRLTEMERPNRFTDEMVDGAFSRMSHLHRFEVNPAGETIMTDEFDYKSRGGPLGWIIENSFLTAHLRRFFAERNKVIKKVAESEGWREYLPDEPLQD